MEIKSVFHEDFAVYGTVIKGFDFSQLLAVLEQTTEKPLDKVIYVPGDGALEALDVALEIRDNIYGGMPVQIGYCNGSNRALNCLEYHRNSELNIVADDVIFLVASKDKITNNTLDTKHVEAFLAPKATAVLLYETALHYAPCSAKTGDGFRVAVVLPEGTNTDKPDIVAKGEEDNLLMARNKWLLAHKDAPEARNGAFVGLAGENIALQ